MPRGLEARLHYRGNEWLIPGGTQKGRGAVKLAQPSADAVAEEGQTPPEVIEAEAVAVIPELNTNFELPALLEAEGVQDDSPTRYAKRRSSPLRTPHTSA